MDGADGTIFFDSPQAFGEWLAEHGAAEDELWVGLWKQGTGQPSLTWPASVDEALCHGWIDGIRKSVDNDRYRIRFTPRRPRSKWSAKNLARVAELQADGRMHPAGIAAFEARIDASAGYSFERDAPAALPPEFQREFEEEPAALAFFEAQPPGYRKTSIHWVMSAQREATRLRRLRTLIEDSANGEKIKPLRR